MPKKARYLSSLLCLSVLSCGIGRATTLTFAYSGGQSSIQASVLGTGSFTFATGLTSVGLADLTAFSFSQETTFLDFSLPGFVSSTFTYGLGDLTSFSLTLAGNIPVAFTLDTVQVVGSNPAFLAPESFGVFDSASAGFVGFGSAPDAIGPVTFTTPEPSTTALLALSGLLLGGFWRARRGSGEAPG
jgi:hypothetical protein